MGEPGALFAIEAPDDQRAFSDGGYVR